MGKESQSQVTQCEEGSAATAGFEDGGRGHSQGMWATGTSMEIGPLLQEGTQLCPHIGFSPVRPMPEFWPTEKEEEKCVLFCFVFEMEFHSCCPGYSAMV